MPAFRTKVKPVTSVSAGGIVVSTAGATTAIRVSWPAAPDSGSPVASYRVYRNGALLLTAQRAGALATYTQVDGTGVNGGSYSYAVEVVSQTGASSTQTHSSTAVKPAPPVFQSPPASITLPSTGGSITFLATDAEGHALTYSLPTTRTGITLPSSSSGLVQVSSAAAGTTGNIVIRATDPLGLYADHTCAVQVQTVPVNLAPVWAGVPTGLTLSSGATHNFAQYASDPEGGPLTFALVAPIPSGYSITTAGVLTAGPASGTVVVRATDQSSASTNSSSVAVTISSSSNVIFNPNVEAAATPQEIFTEDVNNYDGGTAAIVTDPNPRPGTTKSLRLRYTFTSLTSEPGVELKFPAFASTPTMFVRSHERFATGWANNWPVGNKTARYFTNSNFTTDDGAGGWAYCSEKLIWNRYPQDGGVKGPYVWGASFAYYNAVEIEQQYLASTLFANGLPYLREETWYKFERWFVINSGPDVPDGILRIWIDDQMVVNRTNMTWRSNTRGCPNGAAGWSSMWFGGNYSVPFVDYPRIPLDRYMNGFYVSRTLDR